MWRTWLERTEHKKQARLRMSAAAASWLSRVLRGAFATWQDWTQEQQHHRAVVARAVGYLLQSSQVALSEIAPLI